MRVRVYDKEREEYFVSEVYAIINSGFYSKYLVLEKRDNKRYFRLYDYLNKRKKENGYPVNINLISYNEKPEHWVTVNKEDFNTYINGFDVTDKNKSLYSFRGYSFIFKKRDLLIKLLNGDKISYEEMRGKQKEIFTKLESWNYIESSEDIQIMMESFRGFHDSVLRELNYVSGSEKNEKGITATDYLRQVSMIFDSEWSDSIEIVFEGVLGLNLRPAKDNYTSELFSATILFKDKTILFYDGEVETEQIRYEGTWINALGMRWKYI